VLLSDEAELWYLWTVQHSLHFHQAAVEDAYVDEVTVQQLHFVLESQAIQLG